MKRGGQLRRSTPEQISAWRRRSKRIKPVSDKRAADRERRDDVREAVFRRDGYRCQWPVLFAAIGGQLPCTSCFGPLTPHHLWKAGQGGPYTEANLTTLCAFHNGAVEDNPLLAEAMGLVVRRG